MGKPADIGLVNQHAACSTGAGSHYLIQTSTGVLYNVFISTAVDVVFNKSDDGGLSWTNTTTVFAGSATALAVWFDPWSNIAAGLIHCAYQESASDDTLYRTINTESSDALSTQTTIIAGSSTLAGGTLSITRARGGNVYCATMIDAGSEGGFYRLPNANVPNGAWDAARATCFEAATQDQIILAPGFAADNQDILAIFWDADADEISRKIYDDSANSWGETSIATSMVDTAAATSYPHFSTAVDLTNSKIVMVAWSAVDTANADLRCWTITESAITETSTNVVLNSTDDQTLCAIAIDTENAHWYVFYSGKSTGSETVGTATHIYYKGSTDSGATWSPETQYSNYTRAYRTLYTIPRFFGVPKVVSSYADAAGYEHAFIHIGLPLQRAAIYPGF